MRQKDSQEPEDAKAGQAKVGAGLCWSRRKLFAGARQSDSLTHALGRLRAGGRGP